MPDEKAVTSSTSSTQVSSTSAKRRPSKKKVIGVVIAAIVLIGGVGAAAYNLYYQNPQKVLGDAIAGVVSASTLKANAQITTNSDDASSTIDVQVETDKKTANVDLTFSNKEGATTTNVAGSVIADLDSSTYYVKVENAKDIIGSLLGLSSDVPGVQSLTTKIEGNWIKIGNEGETDVSGGLLFNNETTKCVQDVVEQIDSNDTYKKELMTLYRDNQIIVVKEKLGSNDGNLGYVVEADDTNAKSFVDGFNKTTFFADIKKCDDSIKDLKNDDVKNDTSNEQVQVWIDRWSHDLRQIVISNDDDGSKTDIVINTMFDEPITITKPQNTVSVGELQQDIEQIQTSLLFGGARMQGGGNSF